MTITIPDKIDYTELLEIFNDARASATGFPGKETSLSDFKQIVDGEIILTARLANQIVGFASIWDKQNFIHHLYVRTTHQNKGIGRALLDKCKEYFGLPLSLKCVEANGRACSFYGKNGWKAIEKGDGPEGVYILFRLYNSQ